MKFIMLVDDKIRKIFTFLQDNGWYFVFALIACYFGRPYYYQLKKYIEDKSDSYFRPERKNVLDQERRRVRKQQEEELTRKNMDLESKHR